MVAQVPVQQAIAEYRQWDQQTRPLLERLVVALEHMAVPRNNQELALSLVALRDDVVRAQRDLVQMMENQGDLVVNLELEINALNKRIKELESDVQVWRQEYEPDGDPDRPALFSNLRHAFAALFHHAR